MVQDVHAPPEVVWDRILDFPAYTRMVSVWRVCVWGVCVCGGWGGPCVGAGRVCVEGVCVRACVDGVCVWRVGRPPVCRCMWVACTAGVACVK